MSELLIELFGEEIPARMQARGAQEFARLLAENLTKAGLAFDSCEGHVTPRRLAAVVRGLPLQQEDMREERRGPRLGAPDAAVTGFVGSLGMTDPGQLQQRDGYYWAVIERKGQATLDALPGLIDAAIRGLVWPKSMRFADGEFMWVRPLHSILAIFDGQALAGRFSFGGGQPDLTYGDVTYGHRFMAPGAFRVSSFAEYKKGLYDAHVILDRDERKAEILRQLNEAAAKLGLTVKEDIGLLEEVTGLVEWPVAYVGMIDAAFLELPIEVLVTSMRTHQKYFALLDKQGKLARFAVVANRTTRDGGQKVVAGNERVLRARLSDARFFWEQDLKIPLSQRVDDLRNVTFHAKLGTMWDKTQRVERIVRRLANDIVPVQTEAACQAATLAKADLTTGMVGEFPELQGIMGGYYAGQGEVGAAIRDHYRPLGPDDDISTLPASSAILALADKLDSLAGFFSINEKPTGSKDPYALRRAALGVIRLLIENQAMSGIRVPLGQLLAYAVHGYCADPESSDSAALSVRESLLDFIFDRLAVYLREKQGTRYDIVEAVFSLRQEDDLGRIRARAQALSEFVGTPDGENLLAAYRRANNILTIEHKKDGGGAFVAEPEESLLQETEEKALFAALTAFRNAAPSWLESGQYQPMMQAMAQMRGAVDAFFKNVKVNADEPALRLNRLRLLRALIATADGVADFSKIQEG
ncbi:MAG: glycine--tRNA ligase subunit beta [Alphaproteobacteria bacterium]|nr:MAG: glycine--tRNA ligase subunit beta [Alphaproteobacteria bacterium]